MDAFQEQTRPGIAQDQCRSPLSPLQGAGPGSQIKPGLASPPAVAHGAAQPEDRQHVVLGDLRGGCRLAKPGSPGQPIAQQLLLFGRE